MNKLELKPIPGLAFNEEGGKHLHLLNNGEIPGCTSISGLFGSDGWKFAWPPKLMAEKLTGTWLPGVAYEQFQIDERLKQAKNAWREKRDKAADTGTIAHGEIEKFIKTGVVPSLTDREVMNCFNEFLLWNEKYKPFWRESELQVGSAVHRFAGILDAVADINGKTVLLDFKTGSSGDKPEYKIQLAGLMICLEEMGFVPDNMAILHLPKEGKYSYIPIETDLEADKRAFLAGVEFYRHKNMFAGRNKGESKWK